MRYVRFALALVVLTGLLAIGAPAEAQSKTLVWERFDVTLAIQPNGDLRVIERQRIRFTSGSFTFGFAEIPLGKTEGITDVSVSEPGVGHYNQSSNKDPFTFQTSRESGTLFIDWYFPPTADAVRTFDLAYTVHGALRVYDSGDKLQWIAIDNERDFGIQAASVTVVLPPGAAFQIIDSAGARATWGQSPDGTSVTFVSDDALPTWEIIEVGVEFTHGVIPENVPAWQRAQDLEEGYELNVKPWVDLGLGLAGAVLILGGPAAIYYLWYTRGRDPEVGPIPEYVEEPPGALPPGILGTLLDEKADMRDVVATIIDLARKGALRIQETEAKGLFGLGSSEFVFVRTSNESLELNPVEAEVMKGIFRRGRTSIELSDLRNKFYTRLPRIQKKLYREMLKREFFRSNPDTTRKLWRGIGVALIFGAVFVGGFLSSFLSSFSSMFPCVFGGVGLIGLAALVAGGAMPAKTHKGSEAAAKWSAFKNYLVRIEKLADLEKVGELFEKYLPYAIALGIKDSWINKFAHVPTTPVPHWYFPYHHGPITTGSGRGKALASPLPPGQGGLQGMSDSLTGGLQSMSDGLTRMLNSTGRVLQSAPSSSGRSGGGFSSGGFSGGGGGGGGGRGFG